MDRETYKMMAELMYKVPPNLETPIGQKFHIGEIVKLSYPNGIMHIDRYNGNKEGLYQIEYSYSQKYGGSDKKSYSLKHLFENNSSSWYDENELELVKSIEEITEEKDLKEYERLKQKYK